jgi:hypothetical protein
MKWRMVYRLECAWAGNLRILLGISLFMCIPATNGPGMHRIVGTASSGKLGAVSFKEEDITMRSQVAHVHMCEGCVMRLRGGLAESLKKRQQAIPTTVMELDEYEDAETVRTRRRERTGLLLDGDEEEEEQPVLGSSKLKIDPYKVGMPTVHCFTNKVVVEHAGQPRIRKKRDVPIITAVGKVTKRSPESIAKRASINCSLPVDHGLFNVSDLAVYLRQRIKVNGEFGVRQNTVHVELDGNNIVVTATRSTQLKRKRTWSRKLCLADAFSTRYIKYLIKKFICKIELRDIVRCVSTDHSLASRTKGGKGTMFEIKYTNIWKNRQLRVKISQMYGTRLEAARRDLFNEPWEDYDDQFLQVERPEQIMIRNIKATGMAGMSMSRHACMLTYSIYACFLLAVAPVCGSNVAQCAHCAHTDTCFRCIRCVCKYTNMQYVYVYVYVYV